MRINSVLGLRNVREDIRIVVSTVSVLAAAAAIVVLACVAPPSPDDAAQASPAWMYRLIGAM